LIGGEDRFDTAVMIASQEYAQKMENGKWKMENEEFYSQLTVHSLPEKPSHLSPLTSHLIVKSGAGGICIVVNLEKKEGFIIKIMDCDMKARAICTIEVLKQLSWLNDEMLENDLIKAQNKTDILTLHGEKIGQAKYMFKFL